MTKRTESSSFQDLEELDGNQIQDLRSGLERSLGSLEGERRDLRSERTISCQSPRLL